jgi:N-acetylglutamate synthase-like GNAT family acetyltransferase
MQKIRRAQERDAEEILKILKELDLFYPSQSLERFWVAEDKSGIAGIVRLEEFDDYFFLSSLGVKKDKRKKGIAAALLKSILKSANKNIYLYTIVPEFFKKFGFEIADPPPSLPLKDIYGCEFCVPEKCRCMVLKRFKP